MIYILAKLATPTRTLRRNLVYVTGNTGEDDLHLATLYHFYVAYIFYKDAKTNLVYVAGNNGLDDLHTLYMQSWQAITSFMLEDSETNLV